MSIYIAKVFVMAVKVHAQRCIVDLEKEFHVSKTARTKYKIFESRFPSSNTLRSKDFEISIDQCFETVLSECHKKHGENWLCAPLRAGIHFLRKIIKSLSYILQLSLLFTRILLNSKPVFILSKYGKVRS